MYLVGCVVYVMVLNVVCGVKLCVLFDWIVWDVGGVGC